MGLGSGGWLQGLIFKGFAKFYSFQKDRAYIACDFALVFGDFDLPNTDIGFHDFRIYWNDQPQFCASRKVSFRLHAFRFMIFSPRF